jgi:hypothetical protein
VKLNDVGKANGEFQLWADGESVINVSGIIIRDASAGRIRGIQMQTFFGCVIVCFVVVGLYSRYAC